MPTSPPKPCTHPGCPNLVTAGNRCSDHARSTQARRDYDRFGRTADPSLARAAKLRNSSAWQNFRRNYRASHPLCCDPFRNHERSGVPALTEQIHHVMPLHSHPDLALFASNCRPLCTACHARVEGMERKGQTTNHLFANNS